MIDHRDEPRYEKLWSELSRLDPTEVGERTGARPGSRGAYRISFLGRDYRIDPSERRIEEFSAKTAAEGFC